MKSIWENRNPIVANLFNPAFCGEIICTVIQSHNKHSTRRFPFALTFIILPILLHEETRKSLPKSTRTYFFVWVEENDHLLLNFPTRAKSMVRYTKEAIQFTMAYKKIRVNGDGELESDEKRIKKKDNNEYEEFNEIIKKAEMLGKWLALTSDTKSIYSFLRIIP